MNSILDQATQLLQNMSLCDRCLGRQFGNLLTGLTNKQRGFALKVVLGLHEEWQSKLKKGTNNNRDVLQCLIRSGFTSLRDPFILQNHENRSPVDCELCNGIFSDMSLKNIARIAVETVSDVDFGTFLVGSILPSNLLEREDELRAKLNLDFGESMKSELNREVGKLVSDLLGDRAEGEFHNPDVVFVVTLQTAGYPSVKPQINPLFLMGAYRKLIRGIPQSQWDCKTCRGTDADCPKCHGTGKLYETSVEELISKPLIKLSNSSEAKFHGSGREDIDARMLGTGRPFILELKEPRLRKINLTEAETKINQQAVGKVEITLTQFVNRDKVREIKTRSSLMSKSYEMIIELGEEIKLTPEKICEIEEFFSNREIKQRTPLRVLHRRSDKVRVRKVHNLELGVGGEPREGEFSVSQMNVKVVCEGGLYVKELMSGDNKRTKPSLAEILEVEVVPHNLDVLAVHSQ